MDLMNVPESERIMLFEQACMTAEGEYLKNPTDVDNLTRWGESLLEVSLYRTMDEARKMLTEAVSKLEEALSINPAKHEARWCLGNAYTANAFLNSNYEEAKILFDEAFQCFERAVDESPENRHYLQSLAACAKAPDLHKEIHAQGGLGQAQQTLGGGPAASSSATNSTKNKSSDLTYDICCWDCMTAEGEYLKNPTDADNLTRWGGSLLVLSLYGTMDESRKMLTEAVSKLEEALSINPAKHEARFCLGHAYIANAFLNSNHEEAKILFDEAFQCFERALDESPESVHYLRSLAAFAKAIGRRSERLGDDNGLSGSPTPLMVYQDTADHPSPSCAHLEHELLVTSKPKLENKSFKPSNLGKAPMIFADLPNRESGDSEFLTPQKKLLNSIDVVEKVFLDELNKLERTPTAKKAER